MTPFDTLLAGLKQRDPVVAGDAARLLGELGDVRAIPALSRYVTTCRYHYKSAGLVALGELGRLLPSGKRKPVIALLKRNLAKPNVHDDWYWYSYKGVRAAAALAMLTMGDASGAGYLVELAEKQDDVFFCWFGPAILRLEKTCPAVGEVQSRLTAAGLLSTDPRKTRNTEPGLLTMKAQVLGLLATADAIPALLALTTFHSRYVRGQAAASLLQASPGHGSAVESMADSDPADFVRLRASLALALSGKSERAAFIRRAARSAKDAFDRAAAVEALGLLHLASDAKLLARQVAHRDPYVRQCALEALERTALPAAAKLAKSCDKDSSARVRLQAAKILAAAKNQGVRA